MHIFGVHISFCVAVWHITTSFSLLSLASYQVFITFKQLLGKILLTSLWLLGDAQEEMVFKAFGWTYIYFHPPKKSFVSSLIVHLQISCVPYILETLHDQFQRINTLQAMKLMWWWYWNRSFKVSRMFYNTLKLSVGAYTDLSYTLRKIYQKMYCFLCFHVRV
jgi:hypothetical protein